jgi:hypothetical protein
LKYGLSRFALIALLLFAQQAAFSHEAEHAGDDRESSTPAKSNKHFHSGLCAFHAVLDGVLGAVYSGTIALGVIVRQFEQNIELEPPIFSALALIRGARDPPTPILS